MSSEKLRAWWSHKQGLDGSMMGHSAADVLFGAGWARSVAGVGPYLTLFSRAGTTRTDVDEAIARLEIHELPAARGCTYVLPAADYSLGLRLAQPSIEPEMRTARKLGVSDEEIDRLCAVVLQALTEPLEPDALRSRCGDAARSLGPEGVKKGISTTLPLALGRLQVTGDIRRVPINGRLDMQRYRYVRWTPNPLGSSPLTLDAAYTQLAHRYFSWIGPALLSEFQWFSGLSQKAAKAAIEPLGLIKPIEGDERLLLPEEREEFLRFQLPTEPHYVLVSSLDGINQHRRDMKSLLDEADWNRDAVSKDQSRSVGSLIDLPNHAILDRGRIVGLWEFAPDEGVIVWRSFVSPSEALREAVDKTERYIRDEVGDARSFSLDSPKSRAPVIEALRRMP